MNFLKICFIGMLLFANSMKTYAVTYLFSHGFGDSELQAYRYTKEYKSLLGKTKCNSYYIIDENLKVFNYPDVIGLLAKVPLLAKIPLINKTSLGQQSEVDSLKKAYDEIEDNEIILVGVSRGASVAASFMGTCDTKKIKAVVLISPFDHMKSVIRHHFFSKFISKVFHCSDEKKYELLQKIFNFNKNGIHPIDCVENIDKNVPVLFVCTKQDGTVPFESTVYLYQKLIDSNHSKAHLLILETGKHAQLLKSPEAEKFQNVTHAFYKTYGLPCNQDFAEKGAQYLVDQINS